MQVRHGGQVVLDRGGGGRSELQAPAARERGGAAWLVLERTLDTVLASMPRPDAAIHFARLLWYHTSDRYLCSGIGIVEQDADGRRHDDELITGADLLDLFSPEP